MPLNERAVYDGYFHASPECWGVFGEVLAAEFSNAILFGAVHQLSVDTYAVQHAGGPHPDKSIGVHLCGLHLVSNCGVTSPNAPRLLQRLASDVSVWPHFPPPRDMGELTVFDVAIAGSIERHIETVRTWADVVWNAWSSYHGDIAVLVKQHLGFKRAVLPNP